MSLPDDAQLFDAPICCVGRAPVSEDAVSVIHVALMGELVIVGSRDGIVRTFRITGGSSVESLDNLLNVGSPILSITSLTCDAPKPFFDVSHADVIVIAGSEDGRIVLWPIRSACRDSVHCETILQDVNQCSPVCCLDSFVLETTILWSGYMDGTIRIWDLNSGSLVHAKKGHLGDITCMCKLAELKAMATSSVDNFINLWCCSTFDCLITLVRSLSSHSLLLSVFESLNFRGVPLYGRLVTAVRWKPFAFGMRIAHCFRQALKGRSFRGGWTPCSSHAVSQTSPTRVTLRLTCRRLVAIAR